jgi:hypothetical protein
MAILFPQFENDDLDSDELDESQKASQIIFQEYFANIIITSGGQIKFWNGSSYVSKPIKYWTGSAWVVKPIKYWNGSFWVTTNY